MNRKVVAIIAEAIPVVSAILAFVLIFSPATSGASSHLTSVFCALAFLGFVFFIIGRKLAKEDKAVKILGAFDWLATASIIVFYILAIITFGL